MLPEHISKHQVMREAEAMRDSAARATYECNMWKRIVGALVLWHGGSIDVTRDDLARAVGAGTLKVGDDGAGGFCLRWEPNERAVPVVLPEPAAVEDGDAGLRQVRRAVLEAVLWLAGLAFAVALVAWVLQ